ncbi:hypothetical protein HAX54_041223 [Datura stramonium]|uniref:Uncharacterized protein n=1 Tax=Datura stramonium TaxID=4076 RepID=A0ABS8SL53_DATST|nr:hypothetical protein [Datura stramonium]
MPSKKCKGKEPQLLKKTPTEQVYDQDCQGGKGSFPLSIAADVSKKRSSQGESNNSQEDRCWKKVRPRSEKSWDANLAVVEIHDGVDSPSRTLTVLIKESNGSRALPRERSQKSVRERLSSDLKKHSTTALSVFDGKKVVLSYRKMFISELWTVIRGKLSGSDARSALHDKDMEAARKDFSIIVGERLSNAMLKEYKKIEKVSLSVKKEVEEAKLGVSTAEKDFDACNDADLLNSDDLTDLELKKERLEAMLQDLINYKLYLD